MAITASVALAEPAGPVHEITAPNAANGDLVFQPSDASEPALYIVQLGDPPLASYRGGIEGLAPTSPSVLGTTKVDAKSPASAAYANYLYDVQNATLAAMEQVLDRSLEVAFRYETAFNGFAIELLPEEAIAVAKLPNVTQVQRDFQREMLTDYGPQWIGAPGVWNGSASGIATKGEGVIVGIIDSGLNLDHPSFADIGGDGYNHSNPFGPGNYTGLCASNPATWSCNDKLVGYWIFTGETHEDQDGHGSHTASTTAGNHLTAGSVDLTPYSYSPAISGVAPHANIIGYDACLDDAGCPLTALVAAINQATADGVDVINYSIGGGTNDPWFDSDAQAFLAAQNAGVIPVTSAGNSGPDPSTVGSPGDAPWLLTVGASTHNRSGVNALISMSGGSSPPGNIQGKSFSAGYGPAAIVYAGDYGDPFCLNPFSAGTFSGQIVVCDRGTIARVAKGWNVLQGGAGGYVLANDAASGRSLTGDVHHLPAVHISYQDGIALKNWLASGSGHMATIAGTAISTTATNGDVLAAFSSRGPLVNEAAEVIKPDLTAPGVDILAAYRSDPPSADHPTSEYAMLSGTSMSGPHTAGAAALLRALHPSWSPSEVKSALMTTARVAGVMKEDDLTQADPFDMGSGSIRVDRAARAGLVLDVSGAEYQGANPGIGGDPKTLNLASLANQNCRGVCTWTRTVEATANGIWQASVIAPPGMTITVTPSSFDVASGDTRTLTIEAVVSGLPLGQWAFAQVTLEEMGASSPPAHFPIAVVPQEGGPVIQLNPAALTSQQSPNTARNHTLNIGNAGGADLNWYIFEDSTTEPQGMGWSDDFDSYGTGSDPLANGASVVHYGNLSLVPGAAACHSPSDIPWASVSRASGTTTPGNNTPIDVAFDAAGLALGTYEGTLCVESNDPDQGPGNGTSLVVVPVTMVVDPAAKTPTIWMPLVLAR